MAETMRGFNFAYYPKDEEVQEALDTLRPIGILSKAYNQHQLKKYKCLKMGDYPGKGYKMSGYGLKRYNPEEEKNQWVETVKREETIRKNHIVTQGEEAVSSSWKITRPEPLDLNQDTSYFKAKTKHQKPSTYDRINGVVVGYNQKLHRDDREHAKSRGLKVNKEETALKVPVLSSSVYGHPSRRPLEFQDRKHVRVELCKKDFLRLNGTLISNDPDLH